jgi:hypothetical protein
VHNQCNTSIMLVCERFSLQGFIAWSWCRAYQCHCWDLFRPGQEPRAPTRVAAVHRTRKGYPSVFFCMLHTSPLPYRCCSAWLLSCTLGSRSYPFHFVVVLQNRFLEGSLIVLQAPQYNLVNKALTGTFVQLLIIHSRCACALLQR